MFRGVNYSISILVFNIYSTFNNCREYLCLCTFVILRISVNELIFLSVNSWRYFWSWNNIFIYFWNNQGFDKGLIWYQIGLIWFESRWIWFESRLFIWLNEISLGVTIKFNDLGLHLIGLIGRLVRDYLEIGDWDILWNLWCMCTLLHWEWDVWVRFRLLRLVKVLRIVLCRRSIWFHPIPSSFSWVNILH